MINKIDDTYECVGFSLGHHYIPHFCGVILQDQEGRKYRRVNIDPSRAVAMTETELEYLNHDFLFLEPSEQEKLNQTYKMIGNFEVFYTGSEECNGFSYRQTPLLITQFVYGVHAEIIDQLQTTQWDRLNRCFQDAFKLLDEFTDVEKKKGLLRKKLAFYEENKTTYQSEYGQYKRQLEALNL